MKPPDYTYKLNKTQYHKAQTIIEEEQKDILPRWQHRAYLTFNTSVYGFVILFVMYVVLNFITKGLSTTLNDILLYIIIFLSIILIVSFLLNIPLFRKLRKRVKIIRKIGSYKLKAIKKVKEKGFHRFISYTTRFTFAIGVIIIFFALVGIAFSLALYFTSPDSTVLKEFIGILIVFIVSIFIGISLIMNHYLRLHKKRLKKVEALESSLKQVEGSSFMDSEFVDLPKAKYDEIVQLEQDQISYNRMETLLSLKSEDLETYAIQKSKKVHHVLAEMKPQNSLVIADQIDELAMNPEMDGIYTDAETRISHLVLPGTRYRIDFKISKEKKNIYILNLEKQ